MNLSKPKQFREKIRILERELGLLKKENNCGYCSSITLTQCHGLVEIGRAVKTTLKDLSSILSLDTSTTSRTVDSLVKKGYVLRTPSHTDRRSVEICLSREGIKAFHEIEATMNAEFSTIFERIPESDKEVVLHSLDLILNAFHFKN